MSYHDRQALTDERTAYMPEENRLTLIPPPAVVSLDLELLTLSGATLGAQMLADLQARKELDAEQERNAPVGVYSILALVRERMSQVRRVVRNEEDPAHIWAPHNAVADPAITGEFPGDIVLFSRESGRVPLVMWEFRVDGAENLRGTKKPKTKKPASKAPRPKGPKSREPAPKAPRSKKPASRAPKPKEATPQLH
jgi:hypothetical protein